ncbi:hypothetical protein HS125_09885 [bacterium]|nr:hypothetical protein [bacterium]
MRLMRVLRWMVRAVVAAGLLLVIALGVWIAQGGAVRLLSRELSQVASAPITVDDIQMPGLRHAAVENLAIFLPDGRPFLLLERVDVYFTYSGLMRGRLGRMEISGWELDVFVDERGRPEVPALAGRGGAALPHLDLQLLSGRLAVRDGSGTALGEYDVPGLAVRLAPAGLEARMKPPLREPLFAELTLSIDAVGDGGLAVSGLVPDLVLPEAARLGYGLPFPIACEGALDATVELAGGAPSRVEVAGPRARVRLLHPTLPARLTGPRLSLSGILDATSSGQLHFDGCTVGTVSLPVFPQGLAWSANLRSSSEAGLRARLESVGADWPFELALASGPGGATLAVRLATQLEGETFTWPLGRLETGGLELALDAKLEGGRAEIALDARGAYSLEHEGASVRLSGLSGALAAGLDLATGRATAEVNLNAPEAALAAPDATAQVAALESALAGSYANGAVAFEADVVAASLTLLPLVSAQEVKLALSGEARPLPRQGEGEVELQVGRMAVAASDFTGSLERARLAGIGRFRDGELTSEGRLAAAGLEGRALALGGEGRLSAPAAAFRLDYATGEARWSLSGEGREAVVVHRVLEADAGRWTFTWSGRGDWARGSGAAKAALWVDSSTAMALDGRFIGQELAFSTRLDAASSPERSAVVVIVSATGGDVLCDTLYASLSEFPLRVESAVEMGRGERRPALLRAELPGLVAEVSGELAAAGWRSADILGVDVQVRLERVLPLVGPALAPALPSLGEATASGGVRLSAVVVPEPPTALGTLELADVDVLLPQLFGLVLTELSGRLPFSLTAGATEVLPAAPPAAGVREPGVAGLVLDDVRLKLQLSQNRLTLLEPWRMAQYGGVLALHRLAWEDVLSGESAFALEGTLANLDLGQAGAAAGASLFEGRLDCPDFSIHKTGRRYYLSRPLRLVAFGGEVLFTDLSVEEPGSPYMELRTSVEIKRIDLGRLTNVIPVGRITGILEGYARDVVIVGGEEMAFDVDLHTIPTRGVRQEISAKAIKTLLAGTEMDIATTFSSALSHYGYSKLGLKARLADGILHLTGAEKANGGQYFMVGSGLSKVNIVLHGVEGGIDYRRFRRTLVAGVRGIDVNKLPEVQVK